jgi:predicted nucleic acid-binding protein
VSRCYLDTNFLYGHLRSPPGGLPSPMEDWRERTLAELTDDGGVVSPLVVDELAYRLVLVWLRDDGDPDPLSTYRERPHTVMPAMRDRLAATWASLDSLGLELDPTDREVTDRARALMAAPGLAPREAFHAAHAVEADCAVIVSADRAFDRLPALRRLGPETGGAPADG